MYNPFPPTSKQTKSQADKTERSVACLLRHDQQAKYKTRPERNKRTARLNRNREMVSSKQNDTNCNKNKKTEDDPGIKSRTPEKRERKRRRPVKHNKNKAAKEEAPNPETFVGAQTERMMGEICREMD